MNMNVRTILFVVCTSLMLFAMNWFWESKRSTKPVIETQTSISEDQIAMLDRTAELNELPLVRMYRDQDGAAFSSLAVSNSGYYIATRWATDLPDTLYVMETRGKMTSVKLIESGQYLAIYGSSQAAKMPVIGLPLGSFHDVQVLEMTDSNQTGEVYLGEYAGGNVTFPNGAPRDTGIVLFKDQGKYIPIGIYAGRLIPFQDLYAQMVAVRMIKAPEVATNETLYVLENAYQQVVFSSIGGSISEVNLPFKTREDEKSIVLPIGIDREIEKNSPKNALFPSKQAWAAGGVQVQPQLGGYYPLLRRGIEGIADSPPRYYAMNTVGDDMRLSNQTFRLVNMGDDFIELQGGGITKRYSFAKDAPYMIDVEISAGSASNLWLTSGVPDVEIISNRPAPALKYRISTGDAPKVEKLKLPKENITYTSVLPDWVCNSNGYFGMLIDPLDDTVNGFQTRLVPGLVDPTRLSVIDRANNLYPPQKYPGYEMLVPLKTGKYRLYAGPFEKNLLNRIDAFYSNPRTGYNPDYSAAWSFHGWFAFISEPFARILFFLLQMFHTITGSWGFSIILLTLALRLMLFPLNAWSIRSTMRMQQLQPKMAALQEKMKKDPQKARVEMMQLYKEHRVNPFTGGCLPLLIQMPFLIGMFDLLKSAFDLRGASFIPGWIDNLTAPDVLFTWGKSIPFIGNSFHLLPILLGVVMLLNQQMMMKRKAKKGEELDEKSKQAQSMGKMMAIVFTVVFYNFPSGLNIYWMASMGFGMVQQWYMMKKQTELPIIEIQAPKKKVSKRRK